MSLYQRARHIYFDQHERVDTSRVSEAITALLTPENIAKAEAYIMNHANMGCTHVLHINAPDDMDLAFVPTDELRNAWLELHETANRRHANYFIQKYLEKTLPEFTISIVDLPSMVYFMARWNDGGWTDFLKQSGPG